MALLRARVCRLCTAQMRDFLDLYVSVSQAVRVALGGPTCVTDTERSDGSLQWFRFSNESAPVTLTASAASRRSSGGGILHRDHCRVLALAWHRASFMRTCCSVLLESAGAGGGVALVPSARCNRAFAFRGPCMRFVVERVRAYRGRVCLCLCVPGRVCACERKTQCTSLPPPLLCTGTGDEGLR